MSKLSAVLLSCVLFLSLGAGATQAHTPHDDVFDVRLSPTFESDNTVYAIVRNVFFVSTDGGDTWQRKIRGLDHRHFIVSFDIADDGETVYLASLGDGIYRSSNAGDSWERVNTGLASQTVDLVAVAPGTPETAFAADVTGGFYRTTNGGERWETVEGDFGKVTAMAFSPNGQVIYIGDHLGGVYRSENGGTSWEEVEHISESEITSLAVSPNYPDDGTVLVGSADGRVLKSMDGGQSFTSQQISDAQEPIMSVALLPTNGTDRPAFASVWDEGVFTSNDGGESWTLSEEGLTRDQQSDELGRPSFSRLAVSPAFDSDQTLYVAGFDGLFKSTNEGRSWSHLPTLSDMTVVALGFSPDYSNDRLMAATTLLWGTYFSSSEGERWRAKTRGIIEPYPRDIGFLRLFAVAFSPNFAQDNTLFAGTFYDLFKSDNRGDRWRVISPEETYEEWSGRRDASAIAVSPAVESDSTLFVGGSVGRLMRSTDFGQSFDVIYETGSSIGTIVLSPNFGADETVFVPDTEGVHISRDKGETWAFSRLSSGEIGYDEPIFEVGPQGGSEFWGEHVGRQQEKASKIKFAVSPNFETDSTLFAGLADGFARSQDGGDSWERLSSSPFDEDTYVEGVALSPEFGNDETLLVTIRGLGVFRSTDSGESFTEIGSDLISNNVLLAHFPNLPDTSPPIVFSPEYVEDNSLYGFSGEDIWKSDDHGETWSQIPKPEISTMAQARATVRYLNKTYRPLPRRYIALGVLVLFALSAVVVGVRLRRKS